MQEKTLEELVEMMKAGNESAFEELYARFYTSFYYMALKLCKNDADAKDAVQETFIQIQKSIDTLQEPSLLIVWMKRVLFSKCKNIFRKHPREVLMEDRALINMNQCEERTGYLPHKSMQQKAIKEALLLLIQKIPYIYQEPLVLKYYGQHTMEEIGLILDIPTGTVKSRLRTGKQLLQKEMKSFERKEGRYRTFHTFSLGHLLMAAFAYDAKSFNTMHATLPKGNMHPMSLVGKLVSAIGVKTGALCVVACAVAIPMGVSYVMDKSRDNKESTLRNQEFQASTINDQDAYFHLKNWAHCKEELKEKSSEEFQAIAPYYQQLEANKGTFWELLQQDDWVENYIKFKK